MHFKRYCCMVLSLLSMSAFADGGYSKFVSILAEIREDGRTEYREDLFFKDKFEELRAIEGSVPLAKIFVRALEDGCFRIEYTEENRLGREECIGLGKNWYGMRSREMVPYTVWEDFLPVDDPEVCAIYGMMHAPEVIYGVESLKEVKKEPRFKGIGLWLNAGSYQRHLVVASIWARSNYYSKDIRANPDIAYANVSYAVANGLVQAKPLLEAIESKYYADGRAVPSTPSACVVLDRHK